MNQCKRGARMSTKKRWMQTGCQLSFSNYNYINKDMYKDGDTPMAK
jgi:hypothetical protein